MDSACDDEEQSDLSIILHPSRKKVTVDVGTGYYIEMSVEKAQKFCNRRADQAF